MTRWTAACAWCRRSFRASSPRDYCSRPCHDRHKWFGTVPDRVTGGWRAAFRPDHKES